MSSLESREWKWSAGHKVDAEDPDGKAIRDRIDWHIQACPDCRVEHTRQRNGSLNAAFQFCKKGSALIDAYDTWKWTLDGSIDQYMRHRYGERKKGA